MITELLRTYTTSKFRVKQTFPDCALGCGDWWAAGASEAAAAARQPLNSTALGNRRLVAATTRLKGEQAEVTDTFIAAAVAQ